MNESTETTVLAEQQIARNGTDVITIELHRDVATPAAAREPALIVVYWPEHPSLIDPKDFPDTANVIASLFARAHIVLAALKAGRKL